MTSAASSKGNRGGWGAYFGQKKKLRDRHEELDPSTAVAVTAGTQPTLAKRRRQLANEKSVITDSDVNQIFNDLVSHQEKIKTNGAIVTARKRFWKHKFSSQDFDIIWRKARQQYFAHQNNNNNNRKTTSNNNNTNEGTTSINTSGAKNSNETSIDFTDSDSDVKDKNDEVNRPKDKDSGSNNDGDTGDTGGDNLDDSSDEEEIMDTKKNYGMKKSPSNYAVSGEKAKERPPDRWSKLFIGQSFKLGCEFTLDEFEECI